MIVLNYWYPEAGVWWWCYGKHLLLSVALYLYQISDFKRPWTFLFTSLCTASLITANTWEQVKVFHVYFGNTRASLWPTERNRMVSFVSLFLNPHHHMFSFNQDFEIPNVRPSHGRKKHIESLTKHPKMIVHPIPTVKSNQAYGAKWFDREKKKFRRGSS